MPTPEGFGVKGADIRDLQFLQQRPQTAQRTARRNVRKGLAAYRELPKEAPQHVNWACRWAGGAMALPPQYTTLVLVLSTQQPQTQLIAIQPQPGLLTFPAALAAPNDWQCLGRHP